MVNAGRISLNPVIIGWSPLGQVRESGLGWANLADLPDAKEVRSRKLAPQVQHYQRGQDQNGQPQDGFDCVRDRLHGSLPSKDQSGKKTQI